MDLSSLQPFLTVSFLCVLCFYPWLFKVGIWILFTIYWSLPLAFHFIPAVQRMFVFAHRFGRYDEKLNHGVEFRGACKKTFLTIDPALNIKLGIWYILPNEMMQDSTRVLYEEKWDNYLKESSKPIFIYLHGNSGTRAGPNRKQFYALLQSMDYHVIAFDYRGYADSTYVTPTETGLVADAKAVFNHVKEIIGGNTQERVFIWGHSLGTGVACRMVAELCQESNSKPAGLILEAPFTSIKDAVWNFSLVAKLYRDVPAFNYIFVKPLYKSDIRFESNVHISKIDIPICIFHAVDDGHIPFHLGKQLYLTAKRTRSPAAKPVLFKKFGKGFGHLAIFTSPELPDIIKAFVNRSNTNTWPGCKNSPIPHEAIIDTMNNNS